MSQTFGRRLSIAALLTSFLFLAAACEAGATPTAAPTPTPTPALTVDDLLSSVVEKLTAMSAAKFKLVDEVESGAQFFGTTFKSMEGEVKAPDSFRMLVDVVAPGFGFVQIEMMAVGDQAYMKFSKDAPWNPLPLEQVPFNFGGIGVTLSEVLPIIKDVSITGKESIGGSQAIRVQGNVVSEDLSDLITSVDSGHAVVLTLWIEEAEHTLRQIRIEGQLYDDDAPGTKRLLTIEDVNVPVDIQLPDTASGQ